MVKGLFIKNTPVIKISVIWGQTIRAPFVVLDTGFTGFVQINSEIAKELGLKPSGISPVKIATGQIVQVPSALAFADMEGDKKVIEILIADGLPLVGISFLSKFHYKAIIDCEHKIVELEKVV